MVPMVPLRPTAFTRTAKRSCLPSAGALRQPSARASNAEVCLETVGTPGKVPEHGCGSAHGVTLVHCVLHPLACQ